MWALRRRGGGRRGVGGGRSELLGLVAFALKSLVGHEIPWKCIGVLSTKVLYGNVSGRS
jgi:hypothetical protein